MNSKLFEKIAYSTRERCIFLTKLSTILFPLFRYYITKHVDTTFHMLNWCETKNIIIIVNFVRLIQIILLNRVWLPKSEILKEETFVFVIVTNLHFFCFFLRIFIFHEQVADYLRPMLIKLLCILKLFFWCKCFLNFYKIMILNYNKINVEEIIFLVMLLFMLGI